MFILSSSQTLPKMSEFIDPINIPKKYGGQLDWSFGDMPKLDDELLELAGGELKQGLPIGPIKWVESSDGKLRIVAVGSKDAQRRETPIASVDLPFARVFLQRVDGEDVRSENKAAEDGEEETPAARTSAGPPVEPVAA